MGARKGPTNPASGAATLRGKIAVVTGASRGIGFALARQLLAEGCSVAMTSRTEPALLAAMRALEEQPLAGDRLFAKVCDVRNELSVAELFRAIRKRFSRIDYLVNNAGVIHAIANIEKLSLADWQANLDTNATGLFLCTRAALPLLRAGGTIVNNISISGKVAFAGEAGYIASKYAAKGFTDTLREEVRGRGIRVIGLYPGPTNTDIWKQFMPDAPRARMMSPGTIALAVVNSLKLPHNATVEELVILPTAGTI